MHLFKLFFGDSSHWEVTFILKLASRVTFRLGNLTKKNTLISCATVH